MNIIQMLNIWRLISEEIKRPIVFTQKMDFPVWFWSDDFGSGFSLFTPKMKIMIGVNIWDWLDDDDPTIYYWGDKNDCVVSVYEKNLPSGKTHAAWQSNRENKKRFLAYLREHKK